jgi:hypothetical protein
MERKRAAFFRAEKMFASGWEVLPPGEMEEETRRALEVSTVMRKSGPVIRVKQPDRDKALRALEKVHERLERLNERYYAKLEREGLGPSLEEIEAMDGGGVEAAGDFPEKSQVFSGFGQGTAPASGPGGNGSGDINFEKPMVLSGSAAGAGALAGKFPANTMVLSGGADQPALPGEAPGRPQDCHWLLREPVRSPRQLRVA